MIEKVLKRAAYRKTFYTIISLLILVLILLRYVVLPLLDSSIETGFLYAVQRTSETLIASLIVTVGISSFIFWFVPDPEEIAKLTVIGADEIGEHLKRAMHGSDVWWFMGASGRFLRSATLDYLTAAAREGSGTCHIVALLIDPQNRDLCESYAQYRRSLKSAARKNWTAENVQVEVLGTLLRALQVKDNFPQLRVDLGLRSNFSTFRYDLSSNYVIITKEDPQAPAMRCVAPGFYYSAFRGEIQFAHNQSTTLSGSKGRLSEPVLLSLESAKDALSASGINIALFSDDILHGAVAAASKPENPYG